MHKSAPFAPEKRTMMAKTITDWKNSGKLSSMPDNNPLSREIVETCSVLCYDYMPKTGKDSSTQHGTWLQVRSRHRPKKRRLSGKTCVNGASRQDNKVWLLMM